MAELKPFPHPDPESGSQEYENLQFYAAHRHSELGRMLQPLVDLTDSYGSLLARVTWAAGATPPSSPQDSAIRDLLADTFDFLYEWRRTVLEGKPTVAYPLARRAYESLSLMSACIQDPGLAARWEAGKQIGNAEVRAALSKLPFPEEESDLRKLYAFFSKGAHPNRDLVGNRFLGEGNRFVLGSIASPDLLLTVDHCLRLLSMWFWFAAAAGFWFREVLRRHASEFGDDYMNLASQAEPVADWLTEHYNRLLEEARKGLGPQDSAAGAT